MTTATCEECGHSWELTKPADAYREGPRCSECGGTDVSVAGDGPEGGDGGKEQILEAGATGRERRLEKALDALPGVGASKSEYVLKMWSLTDASDDASELYEVVSELEGVSDRQARRVAKAVFDAENPADAPLSVSADDDTDDSGGSFVDKLAKAREAGLLGDRGGAEGTITIQREDGTTVEVPADHDAVSKFLGDDDGPSDAEAIASAVSEAISPALNRMTQAMQDDDGGGTSEVERLREEIEELREEKERERVRRLEEKIEELEASADADDTEIAKLRESRKTLESAPEVSARAAEAWEDVLHGLMDRAKSLERQQALMSEPSGGPTYTPPESGYGEQAPSPRQATANGHDRQDRRAETQENSTPTDTDDTNHDMTDHTDHDDSTDDSDTAERQPEGVTEERAAEVRKKLGLSAGEDADGSGVSA